MRWRLRLCDRSKQDALRVSKPELRLGRCFIYDSRKRLLAISLIALAHGALKSSVSRMGSLKNKEYTTQDYIYDMPHCK